MSISSNLIVPSAYMQGWFIHYVQLARESNIGNLPRRNNFMTNLDIRVAAVVHAALQTLYALALVIPVAISSAFCVLTSGSTTGFFARRESVWEKLKTIEVTAFLALFRPVITSGLLAIDPNRLSEPLLSGRTTNTVGSSIIAQLALFSYTLPPLDQMSQEIQGIISGCMHSFDIDLEADWQSMFEQCDSSQGRDAKTLEGSAFRWKLALPVSLVRNYGSIVDYRGIFTCYQKQSHSHIFQAALLNAVRAADGPDSKKTSAIIEQATLDIMEQPLGFPLTL